MPEPTLIILYVESPDISAAFYARLLGRQPVEASANFAMFILPTGHRLGLWSRATVEPTPAALPGSTELAFSVEDTDAVYGEWMANGCHIAQAPVEMDFGRTFVALDPDGHRLRVLTPNGT